ncbi:unnamed protein product [Laminaria digitata]
MDLFREMRERGLPVTKRRVEYIRDKIFGEGGGRGKGGRSGEGPNGGIDGEGRRQTTPRTATAATSDGDNADITTVFSGGRTPSASVKKASRGAIHGSRSVGGAGSGQGKDGEVGREVEGEEDGEKEVEVDFMAELRDRFAVVGAEELASDDDLAILADEALFSQSAVSDNGPGQGEGDNDDDDDDEVTTSSTTTLGTTATTTGSGGGGDYGGVLPTDERAPAVHRDEDGGIIADDDNIEGERLAEVSGPTLDNSEGDGDGTGSRSGVGLEEIKTMKATELKAELRGRGLRVSGNKAELLARLEEALQ